MVGTAAASATASPRGSPRVLVATVDGAITPVIANYLQDAVARAENDDYDAVVVLLDTPGGLETSMRSIVKRFLIAEVPVVVYVSPAGARAASAGAIVTFAANVAAMAPGTAIGAATPVDLEGGDVERKIINDSAAFAESIAEIRDRDVAFAVDTVRKGRSAAATEALSVGAVDLIAPTLDVLLDRIDGTQVQVGPESRVVTLRTAGAELEQEDLGILRQLQQLLADPNLAFLFMSIGTLALVYEVASPGVGAGAAIGVTLILLALFGLSVLPVNAVGLLLLAVALILYAAELLAPGIGIAAAGGSLALALSGVFLFHRASDVEVSMAVIVPVVAVVGTAVVFAGRSVMRARRTPPTAAGPQRFIGQHITVRRADGLRGQGVSEGAWWNLRSIAVPLEAGASVRVDGTDGLDLLVTPLPGAAVASGSDPQPEGKP